LNKTLAERDDCLLNVLALPLLFVSWI